MGLKLLEEEKKQGAGDSSSLVVFSKLKVQGGGIHCRYKMAKISHTLMFFHITRCTHRCVYCVFKQVQEAEQKVLSHTDHICTVKDEALHTTSITTIIQFS